MNQSAEISCRLENRERERERERGKYKILYETICLPVLNPSSNEDFGSSKMHQRRSCLEKRGLPVSQHY